MQILKLFFFFALQPIEWKAMAGADLKKDAPGAWSTGSGSKFAYVVTAKHLENISVSRQSFEAYRTYMYYMYMYIYIYIFT